MVWLIACGTPTDTAMVADSPAVDTVVDTEVVDTEGHDSAEVDPCTVNGQGSGSVVGSADCTDGVCAVAAGSFWMGSDVSEDECPVHEVTLSGYRIDRDEVSRGAWAACVEAGACDDIPAVCEGVTASWASDEVWGGDPADYPVVCVDWAAAGAYCGWVGGRLPTEAEWERAAAGDEGATWPWGALAPDCEVANFRFSSWYCAEGLTFVGTWEAESAYGLRDVAGNAWEWVADAYDATWYARSPAQDPTGPTEDCALAPTATPSDCTARVIRGGAWNTTENNTRSAARSFAAATVVDRNIGFRCAYD